MKQKKIEVNSLYKNLTIMKRIRRIEINLKLPETCRRANEG